MTEIDKILHLLNYADAIYSKATLTPEESKQLIDYINDQKSEVENLKVLLEMKDVAYEGLRELYDTDTEALIKAREKTEVEVAREIFEEIEVMFQKYYNRCSEPTELKLLEPLYQAERFIINEMWHDVAELKKKYMGGEPNGQNIKE